MGGHQVAGDQCIFRKMNGLSEVLEALQYFLHLRGTPVSLVLVGLDSDGVDGYARVQAAVHQNLVGD